MTEVLIVSTTGYPAVLGITVEGPDVGHELLLQRFRKVLMHHCIHRLAFHMIKKTNKTNKKQLNALKKQLATEKP